MQKLKYIFISLFLFLMTTVQTNAAASLSTSKSQVNKGKSFTVTVKVSSVAAWNVHVSASGPVKGCSIHVADASSDAKNTTKSFSATCTATSTGTITIKLSGDTTTASGSTQNISGTKTVKVVNGTSGSSSSKNNTTKNSNSSKSNEKLSGDNVLKSLTISNGKLSPEFKKDTTEYKVEVENDIEKIKINATANDSEASVKGAGEKKLKVGKNSFGIVVVAENGKTKTYTVVVNRKEEDPIYVTIDKIQYQVVKDLKDIKIPKNFKETTIMIENKEVKALYDDITKFTLVALKDENNNIKLYICDVDKNTYTLFTEEKFTLERLLILDMPKKRIPKNYKKYKQYINGNEYEVYKLNKKSDYALVYALNLDTGAKNLYMYDSEENTMQRYTNEYSELVEEKYDTLFYISLGLCGAIVLLIVILFVILIKKGTKKKARQKRVIESE